MDHYEQDNCIRCYHICQNIWSAEVDEHFVREREPLNFSDRYAIEVLKDGYRGWWAAVRIFSSFCWKMVQLIVWLLEEEDIPQIYHRKD